MREPNGGSRLRGCSCPWTAHCVVTRAELGGRASPLTLAKMVLAKTPPPPREQSPREDGILAIEIGLNIPDPTPKTPRQQAMSERLDSYAAERDLFEVVVQGKPPRAASPLCTPRLSSPHPSSNGELAPLVAKRPGPPAAAADSTTTAAAAAGAVPESGTAAAAVDAATAAAAAVMASSPKDTPGKAPGERYGSRSDHVPLPLSKRDLEALDIETAATAVATPSRMELMTRWSANVDLLQGLTRAQRATIIENADVRVFGADEEIIRQNAVSVELYVVISGCCSIVLPSLEEVWKEKYPSDHLGEDDILASGSSFGRAHKSKDHWMDHAKTVRDEKLRIKDLHKDWHKEYTGALTKKISDKWKRNTLDKGLKAKRQSERHADSGAVNMQKLKHRADRDNLLKRRSRSSRGIYVPGKGFMKGSAQKTVHEELNDKFAPFANTVNTKMDQHIKNTRHRSPPPPDGVVMEFPPLAAFGEQRAFHNASLDGTLENGPRTVSLTVYAKEEKTKVMCIYRQEDIHTIKEAYENSLLEKVNFLRAHHDYGYRGARELDNMARLMRRQWLKPGETLVSEGDEADSIYFVLRGQLSIVTEVHVDGKAQTKPVNVLGAGCSVGQMGVVMDEKKRTASCVALTDSVVLYCHRYNFMRALDPKDLEVMKERASTVMRENGRQVRAAKREMRKKRREERYEAYVAGEGPMEDSSEDEEESSEDEEQEKRDSEEENEEEEEEKKEAEAAGNVAAVAFLGGSKTAQQAAKPPKLRLREDSEDDMIQQPTAEEKQQHVKEEEEKWKKEQIALAHFMSGRAVMGDMTGGDTDLPGTNEGGGDGKGATPKGGSGSKALTGFRAIKFSQAPKPEPPPAMGESYDGGSKFGSFVTRSSQGSGSPGSPGSTYRRSPSTLGSTSPRAGQGQRSSLSPSPPSPKKGRARMPTRLVSADEETSDLLERAQSIERKEEMKRRQMNRVGSHVLQRQEEKAAVAAGGAGGSQLYEGLNIPEMSEDGDQEYSDDEEQQLEGGDGGPSKSKQPVGSRRAGSPLAEAISQKLVESTSPATVQFRRGRASPPGDETRNLSEWAEVDRAVIMGSDHGLRGPLVFQGPPPALQQRGAKEAVAAVLTASGSQTERIWTTEQWVTAAVEVPQEAVGMPSLLSSSPAAATAAVAAAAAADRTVQRPLAHRKGASALGVDPVLRPATARSPLFRRHTSLGWRKVQDSKHAQQEEARMGETPVALMRRMQLRLEQDAQRRKLESPAMARQFREALKWRSAAAATRHGLNFSASMQSTGTVGEQEARVQTAASSAMESGSSGTVVYRYKVRVTTPPT